MPRLVNLSNPGSNDNADAVASMFSGKASTPRRMPRIRPACGSRKKVTGRLVFRSSVAEPPGPVSVMLASASHAGRIGSTNAKEALPSSSATSGMANLNEKSVPPPAERPVTS